jgi:AcrR family transcriptional regulator
MSETEQPHERDELEPEVGESILDGLVGEELGERMAATLRRHRRAEEAWYRSEHPEEGLRERKRRLTRKLISDAATMLFVTRGFDAVKVAEVARRVGVSEKTIYNYFPTKESMVLDDTDEMVEGLAAALRGRAPGAPITEAVVRALDEETQRFDADSPEFAEMISRFVRMLEETPSLHAAWLEVHARLARVATEELAAQAGVDPDDPEPMVAGHALVGLVNVGMRSRLRHVETGLRDEALRAAVNEDVRRAARLLETGLWAFSLPASERARTQAREAARAAEEARRQVLVAMREARAAWGEVRRQATEAHRQAHEIHRQAQEARGRRQSRWKG